MNNKERLTWFGAIFLLALFTLNTLDKVDDLEILHSTNLTLNEIHNDQINDLMQSLNESKFDSFDRGFNEGQANAVIRFMNGQELHDYKEGYHAALSQMLTESSQQDLDPSDVIAIDKN